MEENKRTKTRQGRRTGGIQRKTRDLKYIVFRETNYVKRPKENKA